MSQVFWCDYGDHAAKKTPATISMTQQPQTKIVGTTPNGQPIVDVVAGTQVDICKDCGVLAGIIKDYEAVPPAERHAAIEAAAKGKK